MGDENDTISMLYVVVHNDEEQYSIWRAGKRVPDGWHVVGEAAERQECLSRIAELWTDMRPLSLRKHMAERQQRDKNTADTTSSMLGR